MVKQCNTAKFFLSIFVAACSLPVYAYQNPSRAYSGISYSQDGRMVVIEKPRAGADLPFSTASDMNAICRFYGHDAYVGGLATERPWYDWHHEDDYDYWKAAVMDSGGYITNYSSNHPAILRMACSTDGYLRGGTAESIRVDLLKKAVINMPLLPDYKGLLAPLSSSSDLQGVCRLFGYDGYLNESMAVETLATSGPALVVNGEARVTTSLTEGDTITKLTCVNDFGSYLPRTNYIVALSDKLAMVSAPRHSRSVLIHKKDSNPYGVCQMLGFQSYIQGSDEFVSADGPKAVIGFHGEVTGYKNIGFAIGKLTCSMDPVDQSADNMKITNADGSITISRPRVEFSPLNGEISDRSDLDGVCRYFGMTMAQPDTVVKVFGSRGIQMFQINEYGVVMPRVLSVGMIIHSITCQ